MCMWKLIHCTYIPSWSTDFLVHLCTSLSQPDLLDLIRLTSRIGKLSPCHGCFKVLNFMSEKTSSIGLTSGEHSGKKWTSILSADSFHCRALAEEGDASVKCQKLVPPSTQCSFWKRPPNFFQSWSSSPSQWRLLQLLQPLENKGTKSTAPSPV